MGDTAQEDYKGLMETHPIIKKLLEHGVSVKLTLKEFGRGRHPISGSEGMGLPRQMAVYVVDGFYTSRNVWLEPKMFFGGETPKRGFVVHINYNSRSRRSGSESKVGCLEDIVRLNYDWWQRTDPDETPTPAWMGLYEEFGLVKKETTTRYVPTGG